MEKRFSPEAQAKWLEKTDPAAFEATQRRDRWEKIEQERGEEIAELLPGARKVIDCFDLKRSPDNRKGENILVVSDTGVDETVQIALFKAAQEKAGADARFIVSEKPSRPAQDLLEEIGEKVKHVDAVLLATSLSRSHSKEMVQLISAHPNELIAKLQEIRKKQRGSETLGQSRFISITSASKEILTEGAVRENLPEMRERLEKLYKVMKDIERVHITSPAGTDLEVVIKPGTDLAEGGLIDQPGKIDNFPSGEWGCAISFEGTNGKLIANGVGTGLGRVDQPIEITVKNGRAVEIKGGQSAQKLKEMLDAANAEEQAKNPGSKNDAYVLAELGIGVNREAFRIEDGRKVLPPTSLEGEKLEGSIHIALGRNAIFGVSPEDPEYNNPSVHVDNVIFPVNMDGFKADGEKVSLIEDGRLVAAE